jgi:RNase P/RNase MRP subunit p30
MVQEKLADALSREVRREPRHVDLVLFLFASRSGRGVERSLNNIVEEVPAERVRAV